MCKADYVHYVKEILSTDGRPRVPDPVSLQVVEVNSAVIFTECGFRSAAPRSKQFDIILFWYISIITYGLFQRCQAPPAPPTGCPAPPPRIRHCRTLPGQQFLRLQRFDPG